MPSKEKKLSKKQKLEDVLAQLKELKAANA